MNFNEGDMDIDGADPVERGCGTRKEGGIYSECGLSSSGAPLEDFLIDPPARLPAELPLTAIGVQLIERDGVWHVFDWVGAAHYPNVADFVEEVRRFGMSRRLPKTLDFSKLTRDSRHILAHPRAWVGNTSEYSQWKCPRCLREHAPVYPALGCCAGVWWRDIENGVPYDAENDAGFLRDLETEAARHDGYWPIETATPGGGSHPLLVKREMPSFDYFAHARPDEMTPQYEPAFFASFPISRLAVVSGEGAAESLEAAQRAHLDVAEVPK